MEEVVVEDWDDVDFELSIRCVKGKKKGGKNEK